MNYLFVCFPEQIYSITCIGYSKNYLKEFSIGFLNLKKKAECHQKELWKTGVEQALKTLCLDDFNIYGKRSYNSAWSSPALNSLVPNPWDAQNILFEKNFWLWGKLSPSLACSYCCTLWWSIIQSKPNPSSMLMTL